MPMPGRRERYPVGHTLLLVVIVCSLFWVSMASCIALAVRLVHRALG